MDQLRDYLAGENISIQKRLRNEPFNFSGSKIEGNYFRDLTMPYTIAKNTSFSSDLNADFSFGDFRESVFDSSNYCDGRIHGTNFSKANLSGAKFFTCLSYVNFSGADLKDAIFHSHLVHLNNCDFTGCKNFHISQLPMLDIEIRNRTTRLNLLEEINNLFKKKR